MQVKCRFDVKMPAPHFEQIHLLMVFVDLFSKDACGKV